MKVAWLILTSGLLVAACGNEALQTPDEFAELASAVTARTRTISEMREVAAGFEVIDACTNTFVQVLARTLRERTTGSDAMRERQVTVNFGSINNCLPPDDLNHIISGDGTTNEPTLVRIPDTLDSARAVARVRVIAGFQTFDFDVDLHWTGVGAIDRSRDRTIDYSIPGIRTVERFTGRLRNGTASGKVSKDGTNFARGGSLPGLNFTSLADFDSATITITRTR